MPALITSEFHFTTEDIGAVIDLDPYQAGNTAIDEGLVVNSDTGGIEIEGGGSIRGGLSDFDDTTDQGFFFGFDQNTLAHVATIGDPSNENLTWNGDDLKLDIDGSNLTVNGGTTGQGLVVASDGTVTFVDLVNVLNDLSDVNASPSVGQFLKWSGTQWTHSNITNILGIGDMTDVVISTVATDNILKYNGTNWVNVAPSALGASLVLNDLSNVNASPSVGQFLKWSGTEWSHSNITNILGIGDMTDVVISTVATDNILKYNGTNWVNVAPSTLASSISGSIALEDLSNVTNTSLADDQILVYNAASGGIPARWSNQSVVAVADNIKLRHLDDVSYVDGSPTLTNNKYLKYNGTTWVADDVSLALNDLSNVSVSSPSTGQFLKWNGTSWSASNVTGVLELNDLSGVTITSVATDNILKYNGTNWVNTALSLNDLSGINLGTLPPTTPVVTGTAVPVLAYEASSSQWKATVLELDDLYGVPVPTVEGSILYVSDETHAEEFLWSTNFKMVGGTSATAFPEATDTFTATSDLFAGPSIVLNNENSGMTAALNYHYGSIKFNGNDSGTGANGIRGSIVGDSVGLNGALDLVFSTAADSATVQEAMRLDAGGNLLVGTTETDVGYTGSGAGCMLAPEGTLQLARNSANELLYLNKLGGNDGDIIRLSTDGNEIGVIGVRANFIKIGNGDTHLLFNSSADAVTPEGATDNRDAAIDLGRSVSRFKDLHLSGSVITGGTTTNNFGSIDFKADSVRARIIGGYASGGGGYLKFQTDSTGGTDLERMRIDASGQVGIGTSSPEELLHVNSGNTNDVALFESTDLNARVTFKDNTSSSTINSNSGNMVIGCDVNDEVANSFMAFRVDNDEKMRLNDLGELRIGRTGDSDGEFVQIGDAVSGNTKARLAIAGYRNTNFFGRGIVFSAGGDNGAAACVFNNSSGTQVGSIITSATDTSYNTSSDQRLKENIVDAPSASDDIDAIQVRSFDWKADGSHQKYGMVAQELQSIASDAVYQPEDPEEMVGVDYSKLVPMLVKEIQSLRARVAQLETN